MREAEHLIIRNCKKEIDDVKNGERSRLFQEGKDARHHKNGSKGHKDLPNGLPRKHFREGKPQGIWQAEKQPQHDALHQKCHRSYRDKRIHPRFPKMKSTAFSKSSLCLLLTAA